MEASVTLLEATTPVKLPAKRCPRIRALDLNKPKGRISRTAPPILAYRLRSLRPILHIGWPRSALSCSKGSRGLFVPSRVIGIFTDTTISLSSWSRQRPDHYTIRAGRNLPDKEFRYLRTVIVTAAVRHRAGVRLYTSSCELAQPCVFVKQLPGPILCASLQSEDPLSRSYGVSLPSSLTMNLSTPQYALPDHVCPFAVRFPRGWGLAGFLGSMVTLAVRLPRRGPRTVRFGSDGVLYCRPQRLHPSTH